MTKVFSNLIAHPNDEKFKDLNLAKLSAKLQTAPVFIELLLIAGFIASPDESRLLFDDAKRNDLLDLNKALQSAIKSEFGMTESKIQN